MSVLEEFDQILNEIGNLKAPGVSGSRIKKLTEIAIQNISIESELVGKIVNFCNSIPASHKLGGLYIIDSVSRGFQSEARKVDNQRINYDNLEAMSIKEGSYLSGLLSLNNSIEHVLDTCLSSVEDNSQKEKIRKLVEIWSKAGTFDKKALQAIRNKYFADSFVSSSSASFSGGSSALAAAAPSSAPANNDASSILKSLASLAGPAPAANDSNLHHGLPPAPSVPQGGAGAGGMPFSLPNLNNGQATPDPNAIFQMLQQMQKANQNHNQNQSQDYQQSYSQGDHNYRGSRDNYNQYDNGYSQGGYDNGYDNGYGGYDNGRGRYNNLYSQQDMYNQYNRRGRRGGRNSRSRSPGRNYGNYGERDYYDRRHSNNRQQKVNTAESALLNPGEKNTPGTPHFRVKNVSHDNNLPAGSIKVLSRTLFIGGITNNMDELGLASILRPFAEVQSVILNVPKKHAFVKVYSRDEAVNVISSFNKDGQYNLRLRWGVGFGPRDCCDYQHGISIIPIARLTEADKRWIVSAEWGGTGGAPLSPGLVIDEPDIEIGKGVSSKAISKKMPTDGSRNGPKSTKPGEPDDIYTDPLSQPQSAIPTMSKEANPLANLFAASNSNSIPHGQSPANNNANSNSPPPANSAAAVAALLGSIPGLSNNPGLSALLQQSANNNNNGNNNN